MEPITQSQLKAELTEQTVEIPYVDIEVTAILALQLNF